MNVLNRKMFANRDARRKLADMGGIIASSAELLGTAQKFAPGGRASTEEYLVIIPGITDTPVKLNADTLARLQELSPEAMANATVLDRESAAAQGMDIDRLRPGDLFIERRMMETIRPTIEAPAVNVEEIAAREARITDDARQFAQDRRSFPQPLDRIVDPTGPVGIFTGKTPGEKFMGPGVISGKTPGEKLAGVTSLFRSEPEPVSEPDLVSTTRGRGDDDMRVGFDPNRTITESLALSRGAADAVGPGTTTQDMALSQIMDRAENLTGKDKAVASLEAMIATNQPGLDVDTSMSGALLPGIPGASNVEVDDTGIGSIGSGNEPAIRDTLPEDIRNNELLRSRGTASVGAADDLGIAGLDAAESDSVLDSMDDVLRKQRLRADPTAPEVDTVAPDATQGLSIGDQMIAQGFTGGDIDPTRFPTAEEREMAQSIEAINEFGDYLVNPKTGEGFVTGMTIQEKIADPVEATKRLFGGESSDEKTTAQETMEEANAEAIEAAKAGPSLAERQARRGDLDTEQQTPDDPLNTDDIVPGATDPNLSTKDRAKNTSTKVLSGLGVKDAANMSTKERVKAYQDMFKEFLGEDDADANEEKWHNLAMIGFAIAAGEDPNALANIAGGLLEGSKMMQSQRVEKRKREDALSTMALEQVLSEDAAAQKFERDLALIGARRAGTADSGFRDARNPSDFWQDEFSAASKGFLLATDKLEGETQTQYATRKANEALTAFETRSAPDATDGPVVTQQFNEGDTMVDATHGPIIFKGGRWQKNPNP